MKTLIPCIFGISLVCCGVMTGTQKVSADTQVQTHSCTFMYTSSTNNTGVEVCSSSTADGYTSSEGTSDPSISQGEVYYRYERQSCVCKNIEVRDGTSRSWCKCDRKKYRHILPQNVD